MMFDFTTIFASILGYIFGSIPFALVIGKVFYKTDVRQFGSGNLGGTNTGRVLGKKAGFSVMVLDVLKAAIVVTIVYFIKPDAAALAGVFATLGHIYPLFANFKGGKAVSTAGGYLLAVSILIVHKPIELVVIPFIIFIGILKLTKFVSLSSMVSLSITVIISFLISNNLEVSLYLLLIDLIVIYRHKANINRLLKGEESKVKWI